MIRKLTKRELLKETEEIGRWLERKRLAKIMIALSHDMGYYRMNTTATKWLKRNDITYRSLEDLTKGEYESVRGDCKYVQLRDRAEARPTHRIL